MNTTWTLEGWCFLPQDGKLCSHWKQRETSDLWKHRAKDLVLAKVGETIRIDGTIELYISGFHASYRALDALPAVGFDGIDLIACRVTLGGNIIKEGGTATATEITPLWMVQAQPVLAKLWNLWTERNQESLSSFSLLASTLSARAARAVYGEQESSREWNAVYLDTWNDMNEELEKELYELRRIATI